MLWARGHQSVYIAALVLVGLIFSGCGKDSTPPNKPPQNLIYRATGGTVELNGQVIVTVPAEAISQDAEVQIKVADAPPTLPEGYGFASPVFSISLSVGQVTDTVWLTVAYLDGLLPQGVLEAALLIGHVQGQSWAFEDPVVVSIENIARVGTKALGTWAVIWRAQEPKATAGTLIAGVLDDLSRQHRADFELALGSADVAAATAALQDYTSRLESASGSDPQVAAAVSTFIEANRAIENEGNQIGVRSAADLAQSFLELGRAIGRDAGDPQSRPPHVRLGAREFLPTAFARLFADATGYALAWESAKTGRLQPRDSVMNDLFVQLNYRPTFGGVTYLDLPAGATRNARVLRLGSTGLYRLDLVRADLPAGKTLFYDYVRDRELALRWPVNDDVLLFNFLGHDDAIDAMAYTVEFGDQLVDFRTARANPFSTAAQADTVGSWMYFGLPIAYMSTLRKQDGRLVLHFGSGGQSQRDELLFPMNLRPVLVYGDWTPPSAIADFAAVEYRGNSVRLRWTAPGNDLDSGTATTYDLRYFGEQITESNWDQAVPLVDELPPALHGTVQETLLLPWDLSSTRYMAIRTQDADVNISGLSNVIRLSTLGELEVQIPDRSLEHAIRDKADKPEGKVYASDLVGIAEFVAAARGIVNLEGMQYLPDLRDLDLYSNLQIADLNPLEHMITMQWLRLTANDIGNIHPLWRMSGLHFLDLASNRVQDITPLAKLTNLDSLNLRYNAVDDLGPLTLSTKLRFLDLGSNHIINLDPLRRLSHLVTLNLDVNQIVDLAPLVENTGLSAGDTVDVRQNPLSRTALYFQIPQLKARKIVVLADIPN